MRRHTLLSHMPIVTRVTVAAAAGLAAAVAVTVTPAQASSPAITLQTWLTTADSAQAITPQSPVTLGPLTRGQLNITVDDSRSYQSMSGFGAAFTDSSTYLMAQLKSYSSTAYNTMMNQLFSSGGIGLAFWRVAMGASDFNSTNQPWTDDDRQGPSYDPTQYFALTSMDTGHITPVIRDALAINPNLRIFGTPWSPPAWMKSNGSMICNTGSGPSSLQSQYYQAYADYFVKWIQAYQAQGVPIWAVTPQNEPLYCTTNYPGSSWASADEANWVHNYLMPDLAAHGLTTKVLGFDHNWDALWYPQQLLSGQAGGDLYGIAWHCYDYNSDPTMMAVIHSQRPGIHQYESECSSNTGPTDIVPYHTAHMAALAIQNWAEGVELWNVALNSNNGPHLGGCPNCVPMVTINATTDSNGNVTSASYQLDNIYYQLGQFSKFVPVGATHIDSTVNAHGVLSAAFRKPNGQEVLVATNINSGTSTFEVTWNGQGSFSYTLAPDSTVTFVGSVPPAPAKPSSPAAGLTYKLVNRGTGKPFGVSGASTSDGAKIIQWTGDADADQQWTLLDAGNGYYNIIDVNSGKALDDTNGSTSNGTQMQQWSLYSSSPNQQWQIAPLGNGYFTLTNRTSGLVLDLTGGGYGDGTAIQQWGNTSGNFNQQWALVGVPSAARPGTPSTGHTYRIVSARSGKPFGVAGGSTSDGARIVEGADDDAADQLWKLVDAGNGYYNITDANSGKALDDTNGSTSNGTQMQQWTLYSPNPNQQWQITPLGNGYYALTNHTSGLALDLTNGDPTDGTPIQQWGYNQGNLNQEWQFLPVS